MSDEYPRLPRRHRSEDDPKMIGLWKVGRTIGKGSSGRVRIARHTKTGQYAAVKIVSKHPHVDSTTGPHRDTPDHMRLSIEREIVLMKLIDHPNVMRLYDVWETSSELYLILEYVEGGELFDHLCARGRLPPPEARACFQQLIAAVDYCHRVGVAHRDLKPENVLLDRTGRVKVADFGMAAWQTGAQSGLLQTACGSPHYAAPEVVMGHAYDGRAADIWSCGVILYALLAGRLPFDDADLGALLDKVKRGRYVMPAGIAPDAQDLIARMLERDVERRITMPEIVGHPFVGAGGPPLSVVVGAGTMPDLEALARPVVGEAVDEDVLANVRTLWHGTPEEDIREALRSEGPNWHKGVYHLLIQYRDARLEEDAGGEEEGDAMASVGRRRSRKGGSASWGVFVRTTSQATDLGRSPSTLPPRAAPPTPRRAARRDTGKDSESTSGPHIVLHSPTPPRPAAMPLTPDLPALTIPDVQDDKMQLFFKQIVAHLNAMEIRAGMASAPVTPQLPPSTPPTNVGFEQQRQPVGGLHRDPFVPVYNAGNVAHREPAHYAGPFGELDKENGHTSGASVVKKSSLRNNDASARRQPLRVQIVEPPPRQLTRNKSGEAVSPAWSDSSFTLPSTPRRRWLGNVFKLKPASYQLLSVHDAFTSREECRRLLVGIGVKVVFTLSEGSGVLKCRFDETREHAGIKAVRFRVEVRAATVPQAKAGFQVVLQLIQERGASSSFQVLCQRLRDVWELDVARPVAAGVHSPLFSPTMTDGGKFTDMMVYPD